MHTSICMPVMRHSPRKTVVAVLRTFLDQAHRDAGRGGFGQKQLADLVGKSRSTIQSLELGKLDLSKDLAHRISTATGVSLSWLLKSDPRAKMTGTKWVANTDKHRGAATETTLPWLDNDRQAGRAAQGWADLPPQETGPEIVTYDLSIFDRARFEEAKKSVEETHFSAMVSANTAKMIFDRLAARFYAHPDR